MNKILLIAILAFSLILSACGLDLEDLPIDDLSNAMGRQREAKTPEGHLRSMFNLTSCSAWIGTNTERGLILLEGITAGDQFQDGDLRFLFGGGTMLLGDATASPNGNFQCSGSGEMIAKPIQVNDQSFVLTAMHLEEFSASFPDGESLVMDTGEIYGTLAQNQRVDIPLNMVTLNPEQDIPWTSIENFQCLGTMVDGVTDEGGKARKRPGRAKIFVKFNAEEIYGIQGPVSGGGTMLLGSDTASPGGAFTCAAGQEGEMKAAQVEVGGNLVNVLEITFPELILEDGSGEQVVMSSGSTMIVGVYEEMSDSDIPSN